MGGAAASLHNCRQQGNAGRTAETFVSPQADTRNFQQESHANANALRHSVRRNEVLANFRSVQGLGRGRHRVINRHRFRGFMFAFRVLSYDRVDKSVLHPIKLYHHVTWKKYVHDEEDERQRRLNCGRVNEGLLGPCHGCCWAYSRHFCRQNA